MKYASKNHQLTTCKWGKPHQYVTVPASARNHIMERCSVCNAYVRGSVRRDPTKPLLEDWPGPFVPRPDSPTLAKAVYLNCAGCGQMYAKDMRLFRVRASHTGTKLYCTVACMTKYRDNGKGKRRFPITPRNCIVCGKQFIPQKRSSKQRHCSHKCGTFTQSQIVALSAGRAATNYLASRGLTRETMVCEYCGASDRLNISRKNGNIYDSRPGNLEVICKRCSYARYNGKPLVKQVNRWTSIA